MTEPSRQPGWYPDPNDEHAEIYWDGDRWTERKVPLTSKADQPPPSQAAPSEGVLSGQPTQFKSIDQRWRDLPKQTRVLIGIGVALLATIILIVVLAQEPWHSQKYKDCRAAAQLEGFKGEELESVIEMCVKYVDNYP